jgi:signal transduction histidine kinase
VAADGIDRDSLKNSMFGADPGFARDVLESGNIETLIGGPKLSPEADPVAERYQYIIGIPLRHQQKIEGVLVLGNSTEPFQQKEFHYLNAIAAYTVTPIVSARLNKALNREESKFQTLLDSLPIPLLVINKKNGLVSYNTPAAQYLLEIPRGDAETHLDTILPDDLAQLIRYLSDKAISHKTLEEEILQSQHDSHPLLPEQLQVGVVNLTAKTSTRSEEFLQLVYLENLTEGATASKQAGLQRGHQIMSLVQHELRTPITSMKGALHLLRDAPEDSKLSDNRALLRIVEKNTFRLADLITDLLDVVSLENNELTINPSSVNIAQAIAEVTDDLKEIAARNQVTLRFDWSKSATNGGSAATQQINVWGDTGRLKQLLRHVIDNALKYTRTQTEVEIDLSRSKASVHVDIRDHGPGFQDGFLGKAFEKFTQDSDHLTRRHGGNGIGLYLSRGIAEIHGGNLEVAATSEEGSTMRITLPAYDDLK